MFFLALCLRDMSNLQRMLYAFVIVQVAANFVFLVYPVSLPRGLYPIPADAGPVARWLFNWTRHVDVDKNCQPSLHIANCWLVGLVYLRENRGKSWLVGSWLVLLSFSTLATKQHYLWDVLGGVAVAVSVYALAFSDQITLIDAPRH